MYNESVNSLLAEFGIEAEDNNLALEALAKADSRFIKDLKLNVNAVLKSVQFNPKEAALLALATAANEKSKPVTKAFENKAGNEGATDAEIAEVYACVGLMNTNNIFYRFRHYMHSVAYYNNQPAGLRMSSMMNPAVGKEFFELMSLVVSALNGCERCVTSHEASVKQHGATEQRIYDAIRLGSVIKSLCVIL